MLVHLRRLGTVALLAAGGALLPSACVDNESSILVIGCLVPSGDTCSVQANPSAEVLLSGRLDGVYAAEYSCMLEFANQLVTRADSAKLRTETSNILLYQAEVQVLTIDPVNPTAYAKFTVPITGDADPARGGTPGYGVTNVTLIDAATVKQLTNKVLQTGYQQSVVASVVLHGRTGGGLEITSQEFRFPIDVSAGTSCIEPAGTETCYKPGTEAKSTCLAGLGDSVDCRTLTTSSAKMCAYLNCFTNSAGQVEAHCPSIGFGDGTCCF
jgi:hypothetical protein